MRSVTVIIKQCELAAHNISRKMLLLTCLLSYLRP